MFCVEFVYFECFLISCNTLVLNMDDLATRWKTLSLSDKESKTLALTKNNQSEEYVLAAKFFTRRNVSIDAVAKTSGLYGAQATTSELEMQVIIIFSLFLNWNLI